VIDMNAILASCIVIDDETNDELPGVPDMALYAVTRGDEGGEREPAMARFAYGVWHHVPAHRQHPDAILVRVESADDRREAAEGAEELRRQLEAERRDEAAREREYDRQEEIGVDRWRGLDRG
jgi:hypothetical protein